MNNIVLTNNKDLRLVGMRVGVLSTLRIELPLIDAAATNVEVIITNATTHTGYLATYSAATHCWVCDIAAAQFPVTGKQSYEVAYLLGGKQFWDGKGWIEVTEATTSGISPTPVPPPTRYVCVSVNGYTAQAVEGNIRIPKLFLTSGEPGGTDGYIEGDEIIDTETGYRWVLASITNALTWVQVAVNLSGYYTKAQTDAAINALAAYYITANAQGAAFATYAALANAEAYYSGGAVRIPTRNDYAVVLADETHGGAEYRYIYAVPTEGGAGHWEPQYPIETNEYTALQHKPQIGGVELVGNKTLAQLGIASAADATLTKRGPNHDGFTAWSFSDGNSYTIEVFYEEMPNPNTPWKVGVRGAYGNELYATEEEANYALANTLTLINFSIDEHSVSATRTALPGYVLGTQTNKPVASEAEAESLREKKYEKPSGGIPARDLASAVQTSLGKADTAVQPEAGKGLFSGSYTDLTNTPPLGSAAAKDVPASGDASSSQVVMGDDTRLGDARTPTAHAASHKTGGTDALTPSDIGAAPLASPAFTGAPTAPTPTAGDNSTKVATTAFVQGAVPYSLVTKTIDNGAVTLDNRAINAVAVSSSLASLTINFPAATSGKVRDFGLRLTVASGITTAPELALPQGVVCENADGEAPEIGADGAATILYFTETASGVFLVKGEVVTAIS